MILRRRALDLFAEEKMHFLLQVNKLIRAIFIKWY